MYPDPQPLESVEEWSRSTHADIPQLSLAELHRELALARVRAAFDDEPSLWLRERLHELEAALTKHEQVRR